MNKLSISELKGYLATKGWSLSSDYNFTSKESNHLIEACINTDTWNININIENFDIKLEQFLIDSGAITVFSKKTAAEYVAKAVVIHEIGHYKHCPRNKFNLADIFNGISRAGEEMQQYSRIIGKYKFDIANMFSDIVNNATSSIELSQKFFSDGLTIFYNYEGYLAKNSGKTMGKAYSLFSNINLKLIQPNIKKRDFIEKYYAVFDKSLLNQSLEIFTGFSDFSLKDTETKYLALINLYKEHEFENKAYNFAKLIAPLMEYEEEESNGNNSGKEVTDSPYFIRIPKNGMIERFNNDKRFNEEVKREMIGKGNTSQNNIFFDNLEYMDFLYKEMARKYSVEFNLEKLSELNIISIGEEEWKGDFSEIDLLNIRPSENGSWHFQQSVKKEPITLRNKGNFDFPDILYLYDTSGSMSGSRYDLLLKAIYSSLNCLEDLGKAADMKFNFTQFSNKTISSGWIDYYSLEQGRKDYLFRPEFKGTLIDYNSIENIFGSARGPFHTIMVTDGGICNEGPIVELFKNNLEKDYSLDYISIGNYQGGFMSLAEEHKNAKCTIVNNDDDLINLIIGITKKKFNN